jgi:hypothetical protein
MQLDISSRTSGVSNPWQPSGPMTKPGGSLQPGKWVNLREPLSPLSHDEALLLCRETANRWTVWVPGHGEATVDTSQFC